MAQFSYPKPGAVIRDIEGRRYKLVAQLNQGRQGAIYTTEDENILVKVRKPPDSSSADFHKHLRILIRRNLEVDALVLPRAVLDEPYLGYVMDRVNDSISLVELVYPKILTTNWHVATGGLRRRLRIAAQLARTIQQIHRNGLCYVDLSWQNVLVSSDPKQTFIKLIDADNLIVPGTSFAEVMGSPGFIAPEILKESRFPDHACDRWSLAVAIFHLLVLNHPFIGDEVLEGEPELEEIAYRGELPFIDSRDNKQNRSTKGLPLGRVLTRKLRDLSRRAFENGVADPWARPSPEEWLIALLEAADQTALCPKCGATTYLPEMRGTPFVCDWCGQTSDRPIELGFFNVDPAIDNLAEDERKELIRNKKPHRLVLDEEQQRIIPTRLVSGDLEAIGNAALFGSTPNSNGDKVYGLKNLSQDTWKTKDAAGDEGTCDPGKKIWLSDQTLITFPSGIRAKVRNPYPHMGGQG
ncbi:MAG TPA: hypothetical protein VE956_03985 [Nodularia sp. (in: cyanobacteria)]|nr:hypothetical protein [Nodularia sp. (in: cyanobacteria)]